LLRKTDISNKKRLKSKKAIEEIFNSGNVVYSSDKSLRAHYLIHSSSVKCGIKSSVAVSKKAGKSVWRNRAKRLIREANRLNNQEVFDSCLQKNKQLEIIFITNNLNETNNSTIALNDVQKPIEEILNRVREELIASSL
jgi:ribonuclease P protein component